MLASSVCCSRVNPLITALDAMTIGLFGSNRFTTKSPRPSVYPKSPPCSVGLLAAVGRGRSPRDPALNLPIALMHVGSLYARGRRGRRRGIDRGVLLALNVPVLLGGSPSASVSIHLRSAHSPPCCSAGSLPSSASIERLPRSAAHPPYLPRPRAATVPTTTGRIHLRTPPHSPRRSSPRRRDYSRCAAAPPILEPAGARQLGAATKLAGAWSEASSLMARLTAETTGLERTRVEDVGIDADTPEAGAALTSSFDV